MKNLKNFLAICVLCVSINATSQRLTSGSPFVNYIVAKESNIPMAERRSLVLDNPLGVEIGMVQILDNNGRLIDATIVRGHDPRIDLKDVYLPTGDYVLVFNTMLGFSFVQEVTRAEF